LASIAQVVFSFIVRTHTRTHTHTHTVTDQPLYTHALATANVCNYVVAL